MKTKNKINSVNTMMSDTVNGRNMAKSLFPQAARAASLLAIAIFAGFSASAANNWAWDTAPGTAYFSGGNWTSGTTPGSGTSTPASGDSLFFGTSSRTLLTNDNSSFTYAGITHNSGASALTIAGNAFTLTGGISNNSTSAETNNCNITLGGTVMVTNSGILTLNGVISDGGNGYRLSKSGGSTLNLFGANTYTGPTLVTNGTVNVTGDESAATGGWQMPGGAVNSYTTTVNFQSGSKVYASGGNCNIGAANSGNYYQTMNVSGTVTNTAQLNVNRLGVLNINNGGLWLNAGAMTMIGVGGFGATMLVNPGGSFIYTGTSAIQLNGVSGNGGISTLMINGGAFTTGQSFTNINFNAKSTGSGKIIFTNNGSLFLSANIPQLASWLNTNSVPTIWLTNGGGAINLAGFSTTLTNCLIGGNGNLTLLGGGTLTLGATNTCTGSTIISNGTLAATIAPAISTTTNIIVDANGTLDASALGTLTLASGQTLSLYGGTVNATAVDASGATIFVGANGSCPALDFERHHFLRHHQQADDHHFDLRRFGQHHYNSGFAHNYFLPATIPLACLFKHERHVQHQHHPDFALEFYGLYFQ